VKNGLDNETGSSREAGARRKAAIVAAWRAYVAAPEGAAEELLRAIEGPILMAVARHNRRRLDYAQCEDVAQEVRLELVPQGCLLDSADLRALTAAADAAGWSEASADLVWQKIINLIYMIARREVSNYARGEERHRVRQHAWFESERSESAGRDEAEQEQWEDEAAFRQAALRAGLRAHGYTEQDGRLIESYFAGHLTQAMLGETLGLQQGAVSKRVAVLRDYILRACRRREDRLSPGQ
jgi:hypothetical protein